MRIAVEQRTPIDCGIGPIPEGSRSLAGGETVEPSRPPVTNAIDIPPRMGQRNEWRRPFRSSCRGINQIGYQLPGLRCACRPAMVPGCWPSGILFRRPNDAVQFFEQLLRALRPESFDVEGFPGTKRSFRCADHQPEHFGVRVVKNLPHHLRTDEHPAVFRYREGLVAAVCVYQRSSCIYFKLTGICCSERSDSSSMKYHFTPAWAAALKRGGKDILPCPTGASLFGSE